jgi:hypothetical protein
MHGICTWRHILLSAVKMTSIFASVFLLCLARSAFCLLQEWLVYPSVKLIIRFVTLHDDCWYRRSILFMHTLKPKNSSKKTIHRHNASKRIQLMRSFASCRKHLSGGCKQLQSAEAARILKKKGCHCPLCLALHQCCARQKGWKAVITLCLQSSAGDLLSLSQLYCRVWLASWPCMEETSIGTEGECHWACESANLSRNKRNWAENLSMESASCIFC